VLLVNSLLLAWDSARLVPHCGDYRCSERFRIGQLCEFAGFISSKSSQDLSRGRQAEQGRECVPVRSRNASRTGAFRFTHRFSVRQMYDSQRRVVPLPTPILCGGERSMPICAACIVRRPLWSAALAQVCQALHDAALRAWRRLIGQPSRDHLPNGATKENAQLPMMFVTSVYDSC
jgi:hypothetical protein